MRVVDSSKASDFFVDSEGPDQTVRMRSLIWVFAVRICPKIPIRLSMSLKILLFPGEQPPAWTECNIGNDLPAGTWRLYNVGSTSMQRITSWRCIDVEPTYVDATSWRCIDVEPTLYKRHVPAGLWVIDPGAYVISYWFLASTERSQCITDHDSWPGQESRYAKMGPCLFVLRFHGPVNFMGSCWARSVYLTSLSRLSSLSS